MHRHDIAPIGAVEYLKQEIEQGYNLASKWNLETQPHQKSWKFIGMLPVPKRMHRHDIASIRAVEYLKQEIEQGYNLASKWHLETQLLQKSRNFTCMLPVPKRMHRHDIAPIGAVEYLKQEKEEGYTMLRSDT